MSKRDALSWKVNNNFLNNKALLKTIEYGLLEQK